MSQAPKVANQRGVARLGAVQALYQMDVGGATLPAVIAEFEAHRLGEEMEGETLRPADVAFFRVLVSGVVGGQRQIDPIVHAALPPTWPLTRIDLTLRAILRCGVFELTERRDVPARVVITEYLDVANAFFAADEPGLVNGVLDRVARDARPQEFAKASGGQMDELAILERILKPLAGEGAFGFRDDAAKLAIGADSDLVVTKDMLAEGVHFLASDPPFTIAQKALRVNLSDLAAKGAAPAAAMLGLALGPSADADWLTAFGAGLAADLAAFGLGLLGGDTISVAHGTLVSVTAFGAAPRGAMVHRFGGRAGDLLYVSGAIGEAALGLRLLTGKADAARVGADEAARLIARYRVPSPRVGLAPVLAASASAAMDVSDGLVGDCDKLAAASGCGAVIEMERVPLADGAAFGVAPETLLAAGDDYEILAAVPPDTAAAFEAAATAAAIVVTRIGRLEHGGGATAVCRNGVPVTLGARAWVHGRGEGR